MKNRFRWGPSAFAVSVLALIMSLGASGYAQTVVKGAPAAARAGAHPTAQHVPARLPAWHNLTLGGGWVYGGFNSYHAAFFKDSQGIVHLRGSARHGNTNSAVFRLPPGDRPAHTLWLPVYAFQGSAGGLEIKPTGQAFLFDSNSGNNVRGYSSFDGISFRVP